ncbi:probable E3 ubiquitin-protein ligase XBOS34 [Hordeum vulgare subsp. vulgare]|uniref:probable E3 ubiquitin-protein ligase XBOS34 n=1 Tax=Hordeum vulgare subsp. vulgare TaxID=112509 RepID=UPI001D1A38FB|nr:probable E3 ubiquitin-protein ligase XBOS34 [Hordeum vulgare subsp. vulgare]
MGLRQSKAELLFQQVNYGNVEGIRNLRAQGAGVEWINKEGKTPLMVASMRPDLLNVARLLITLGANLNAFRPGSHAGTPLHHAAKRGLDLTVQLLLSHGANPFVRNDDCNTALDVARGKGHLNVVRAIEGQISLFSGWMRENCGPPQVMTRKIWIVILPREAQSPTRPVKLELSIYPESQAAKPCVVAKLWKCQLEAPKYNLVDPSMTIFDKVTTSRYELLPAYEGDKQQLRSFYSACCSVEQVASMVHVQSVDAPTPNSTPNSSSAPSVPSTPSNEDVELQMAINASIQSAIAEGVPDVQPTTSITTTSGWGNTVNSSHNGWGPSDSPSPSRMREVTGTSSSQSIVIPQEAPPAIPIPIALPSTQTPTAPPLADGDGTFVTCVICLDAPVEGACIPCGHMAGCMSCLTDIESKKCGCPICRAEINQIIRLYAV